MVLALALAGCPSDTPAAVEPSEPGPIDIATPEVAEPADPGPTAPEDIAESDITAADITAADITAADITAADITAADVQSPDTGPPAPDVDEPEQFWVIDHALWTQLDARDDPFTDRPADALPCPSPGGFDIVQGSFEVDTDFCLYMTTAQPSLIDIPKGWVINAVLWHLDLLPPEKDPEAAEAHLSLKLGDIVLWDGVVPIPGPSKFIEQQVTLDQDVPLGTPVYFHVHNHGPNSYRLLRVTAQAPKPIQ
ncbi:MAG: hypothetical protein ACI9WU_003538 [Myxococcota bacterium]